MTTTTHQLRSWVSELPGAREQRAWGHLTFRVGNRMFAWLSVNGATLSIRALPDDQSDLIARDPTTYFVPEYVGRYGWVGVMLRRADPDELRELFMEGWRLTTGRSGARDSDQSARVVDRAER